MNKVIQKDNRPYKKTEVLRFGFFMLLYILVFGCGQEQSLTAEYIVEQSIKTHGGLDNWKNIKSLQFQKKVILYNADETVEKETNQLQNFEFSPTLKGSFKNLNASGNKGFNFDGEYFYHFESDTVWQEETDPNIIMSLTNSFYAAHYVICQPFGLLNENVILTYSGDKVFEVRKVHVIDVAFKGDEKDADKWCYYFDTVTFELVANKVIRPDHTSLVENLTFDASTDFKFNATRKSYRLLETGEKDYLRADYFYSNFKVKYITP